MEVEWHIFYTTEAEFGLSAVTVENDELLVPQFCEPANGGGARGGWGGFRFPAISLSLETDAHGFLWDPGHSGEDLEPTAEGRGWGV